MTTEVEVQDRPELRPELRAYLDDPSTQPREFAKFAIHLMNLFDYSFDDVERVLIDPEESWTSKSQIFYLRGSIAVLTSVRGRVNEVRTREYALRSRDGIPIGDWNMTTKAYYSPRRQDATDEDLAAVLAEPVAVFLDPRGDPDGEWVFGRRLAMRRVPLTRSVTRVAAFEDATPYFQGTSHGGLNMNATLCRRALIAGLDLSTIFEAVESHDSKRFRPDGHDVYTKANLHLLVRQSTRTIVAFSNQDDAFSRLAATVIDGVAIGRRVLAIARRLGLDLNKIAMAVNAPDHEAPRTAHTWSHRRGNLIVVTTENDEDPTTRLVVSFSPADAPEPPA